MRRRWCARAGWLAVAVVVLAATGVAGGTPAGAQASPSSTTPVPVSADPCRFVTAAAVEAALGIPDPDGPGPFGSAANRCIYGQPFGLHFRVVNTATGDGGRYAKDICARAQAGSSLYTDYSRVAGVGKRACRYTLAGDPTMLVTVLNRGSKRVGRVLTLAVSGTPTQLFPIADRIDAGLVALAGEAATAARQETR